MTKTLLFSLVLLAIGFGVSQVFLQGEEANGRSQIPQGHIAESPSTQTPITEVPIVEPQITREQVAPLQSPEPAVTQKPKPESQGEAFYYLLHPDRKNGKDDAATEDAKN